MASCLYIVLTHDDFKRDMIDPIELSDTLSKLCPLEYAVSIIYLAFIFLSGSRWWLILFVAPLCLYNLKRIATREHK